MEYVDLSTVSDEQYDEELNIMFSTKGWKYLKSELFANSELVNDVQTVKDERDLAFKQGFLSALGYLLNLEKTRESVVNESS